MDKAIITTSTLIFFFCSFSLHSAKAVYYRRSLFNDLACEVIVEVTLVHFLKDSGKIE